MFETVHPEEAGESCLNCGHSLNGSFCPACGQAERDGRHPTIGHFFHDLLHEFVHVDGKIFRTLKALFLQPGKLTDEYWAGHIVAWIRPIRLFLVVAAIHLLLSNGVSPLNWQVRTTSVNGTPGFGLYYGKPLIDQAGKPLAPEDREKVEQFKKAYDSIRYGAFLIFGCACWLLYRKRQPYFANHVIAGLHFYCFWYCFSLLVSLPAKWAPDLNLFNCLAFIYLFLTLRRLFAEHWLLRVAKAFALVFALLWAEFVLYIAAASWVKYHPKIFG